MVFFLDAVTRQPDSETTHVALFPILVRHFLAIRPKPGQVFDVRAVNASPLEKLSTPEDGMRRSKHDQPAGKCEERLLFTRDVPIEPAHVVILTIGVIIPILRSANLVAAADHGNALREQ